ncbi:hypothetical protein SNEBB_008208 [Seison nebaliae]|nr:hypothetical protein SNEBB_008208 [Seison nebaliae]
MPLSNLFGHRKTPDELLKENQRMLNRSIRELDRERMRIEQQEKRTIADIKKMAKAGQMDAVKVLAKDVARSRRTIKKFMLMKANIQAISLKIVSMKSSNKMAQAMKGVAQAMGRMNKQMNLPEIQKIMMEFEKQSEMMDMKEEMMDDAIDDALGDDDDEEETDQLVNKVLDELGIQMSEQMAGLQPPNETVGVPGKATEKPSMNTADADLEARLENLRRN